MFNLFQENLQKKIIFEDQYLLVVDKPPGLPTTSSDTNKGPSLEQLLATQGLSLERSGIVHRLDKDTSGLVLVAKTQEVMEKLQAQFKERSIEKEYVTLVHGLVEEKGRVDAAIMRNPINREKFVVATQGLSLELREAVTEYEPIKNLQFTMYNLQKIFSGFNTIQMRKLEKQHYGQFTLLTCHPLTGRTHQIRVHLKYIGHPVVGDDKYAGRKMARLDRRWCPRQFLHAKKINFTHPVTKERISLESKLPEDLKKALENLEHVSI